MDGRWPAVLLTLVVPAGLLGLTIYKFAANPLAVLVLLTIMFGGMFYLLTYTDAY
jgi:hypothetical protein